MRLVSPKTRPEQEWPPRWWLRSPGGPSADRYLMTMNIFDCRRALFSLWDIEGIIEGMVLNELRRWRWQ